jgi:HAD superfamily phosphatase (TIGR01668 family)
MTWEILLQPNLVLKGSVLNLTPELLRQHNLQGLILDVDETLVPMRRVDVSQELQQWTIELKSVAKLALLSNNLSETRIARIAKSLDLPYFYGAAKPSRRKLRQAVAQLHLPVEQIAMVGDRLFTDVLAGNRLGMFTILVEPMLTSGDSHSRYSVRNFEVWVSQLLGASLLKK